MVHVTAGGTVVLEISAGTLPMLTNPGWIGHGTPGLQSSCRNVQRNEPDFHPGEERCSGQQTQPQFRDARFIPCLQTSCTRRNRKIWEENLPIPLGLYRNEPGKSLHLPLPFSTLSFALKAICHVTTDRAGFILCRYHSSTHTPAWADEARKAGWGAERLHRHHQCQPGSCPSPRRWKGPL